MTEFTVDLVSNASMQIHPKNNLSAFTNEFNVPIELEREYEVAITEIFHPSIVKISTELLETEFEWILDGVKIGNSAFKYSPSSKIADVLDKFNQAIKEKMKSFKADMQKLAIPGVDFGQDYKIVNPIVKLSEEPNLPYKSVVIYPGYLNSLGRTNQKLSIFIPDKNFLSYLGFVPSKYISEFKINPYAASKARYFTENGYDKSLLFIYCDIIAEHHVGDSMANSLRVVPLVRDAEPKIVSHTFIKPIYFPVKQNRITSISVMLTDETGHPAGFNYGTVYLTLHFRPRRNLTSI